MSAPMKAGLAPDMQLGPGYVIEFTTISATTGNVVSGAKVSNASLLVQNVDTGEVSTVTLDDVPLFVPVPADSSG